MRGENFNILKTAKTKLGNEICLLAPSDFVPTEQETSLVIGVFHGDEPQGKFLIEEYLKNYPTSKSKISVLPQGEDISCNKKQLIQLGKNLRNNSTKEEIILWQHLKQKQLGVKFRRQQPIDKYIADFACFEKRIIIELDGSQHNESENIEKDKIRDLYFEQNGFKVIRIWNNEITQNIEGVIEKIKNEIECPPLAGGPKSLMSRRGQKLGGKSLLFIPCLNPDGMRLGQRTNANGVDLNRNFPTKNWGEDTSKAGNNPADYFGGKSAGSELETQFVIDVINEYQPKSILTLHAPYKVVNFDGPAKELAQEISDIIKYPVEESIGYPTPGSFGTYAGVEREIPTITLELDEKIPVEQLIQPVFEIFDELL